MTVTGGWTSIKGVYLKKFNGIMFVWLSQVLLSLPCIKPHDLAAFEEALSKTSSPKEQKQHMKSLLILATGNNLKALAVQKSLNVITNVSSKHSYLLSFAFLFFSVLSSTNNN